MRARALLLAATYVTYLEIAAASPAIPAASPHPAVDEVVRLVREHYVFPEKRAAIVAALRAAEKAGRYDTGDPATLSAHLTEDLYAASRDKHLWVHADPEEFARQSAPANPDQESPWSLETAQRRNDGYEEMRILPGNVRYVRVTNFMWFKDRTGRVIDDVARFLREGDAVVIDLRGDGGGDGRAVQYLVSHFFDTDRLLITFDDRLEGEMRESRVIGYLPDGRLASKPLYTLIDDGTASAAEEFAYHVAQFKLGVLVGATTAGAANNNSLFPVPPGFVASISTGRPIHPVSHGNWEGVGVKPEIEVAPETALDTAHLLALRKIATAADEGRRQDLDWTIVGLEARLHPVSLAAADLPPFAGHYGIRTVRVENGGLIYQREGRDPVRLAPLAPDLFAFANTDDVRVRFRRAGGKVVGFDQVTVDHQVIPSERTD